jgi:RNA recognition motif-containing protein
MTWNLLLGVAAACPVCKAGGSFLQNRGDILVMETKLYVGNLSYNTSEDDLRTLFSQAGTVTAVDLIKDRDTGRSKGFAFVTMSNQSEMEKAIQMFNSYSLDNRALNVNIARPREERDRGGYGGGGNRQNKRSSGGGSRRY